MEGGKTQTRGEGNLCIFCKALLRIDWIVTKNFPITSALFRMFLTVKRDGKARQQTLYNFVTMLFQIFLLLIKSPGHLS